MHVNNTLLRAAVATAAAAVMTLGAGTSAQAAMVSEDGSEKGAARSAEAQSNGAAGKRTAEENRAAAAEKPKAAAGENAAGADHSEGNASTQGEPDEAQPESTADENDGGANAGTCAADPGGPYCSTRDGSASENGKGDGEATGRPAAGTVGKADNKNPRGQLPGPDDDGDNGYECDGNQGIAQGNPAHTGCTDTAPEVEGDLTSPGTSSPETGGTAGVTTQETAEVLGVQAERSAPDAVMGEPAAVGRAPAVIAPVAGILPATGAGDHMMLLVGGGALVAAGGTVLARRRAHGA